MRFAIFTHVEHIRRNGRFYAYAPYVREMNLWLKHVEKVEVVAPLTQVTGSDNDSGGFGIEYEHSQLIFNKISCFDFLTILSSIKAVVKIPFILFKLMDVMRRADHLHLRCPGNIGLLACIGQIFFPSKAKSAKYAGNWDPQAKQPWTYNLQKWILSNTFLTRNMQVLVYGEWPGQTNNVIPFFTASFAEKEKAEALDKTFLGEITFLFVGNLVEGKRPMKAVKLLEDLNREGITGGDAKIFVNRIKLEIYGDGPEREKLETYCRKMKWEERVIFKGIRPLEDLKDAYRRAHFVILPSRSEGWPKALAEGMFFGCIPIATPVSCVPWMLSYGDRGVLLKNQTMSLKNNSVNSEYSLEDIEEIFHLLEKPLEMQRLSKAAKKWSQKFTLEVFEAAIKEVLLNSNGRLAGNISRFPSAYSNGMKKGLCTKKQE